MSDSARLADGSLPRPVMFVAALLICIALGWSLQLLLTRPLWLDEAFSGAVATGPMNQIIPVWLAADVHPPLHYVLLSVWTHIAGSSDVALRLPSLVAIIAMIIIGGRTMARRKGSHVGWIAAVALAVPGAVIWYGAEARSYALQMLLALLLILLHLRVRERWDTPGLAGMAIITGLLALTHYFGFLFATCIWVVLLQDAWRAGQTRAVVVSGMLTALAVMPWLIWHLPYMLSKTGGNFWIPPQGFGETLVMLAAAMWGDAGYAALFGGLPLAIVLAARFRGQPVSPGLSGFPIVQYVLVCAIAILALSLLSLLSPLVVPRYLSLFVPLSALIATDLFARVDASLRGFAAVAAGAIVLMLNHGTMPHRGADWLAWAAASHWVAQRTPDRLLFVFDDPAGRHIGTSNLASVGAFFLRRAGQDIMVEARTPTRERPVIAQELPSGMRTAVILVAGQLPGAGGNAGWLNQVRARYPDHICMASPETGPHACIFTVQQ